MRSLYGEVLSNRSAGKKLLSIGSSSSGAGIAVKEGGIMESRASDNSGANAVNEPIYWGLNIMREST